PHQPDRQWCCDRCRLALGRRARRCKDALAPQPRDRGRGRFAGTGPCRGRDQIRRHTQTGNFLNSPTEAGRRYQEMTMTTNVLRIMMILAVVFVSPKAVWSGEAHWPATLTIGTGSPGGTYYDYGEGLAKLVMRKLATPIVMRSTDGPAENIKLLETGEIE